MPAEHLDGLPFVDEHRIDVAASAAEVWRALAVQIPQFTPTELFARLLGTEPARAAGTPLEVGATLPGFAVAEAVAERRVRLAGRHRFSRYALVLDLQDIRTDQTTLAAHTYAAFPGLVGGLYRSLVIGSGMHRILVMRLLRDVRRRAEKAGTD